MNYDSVLGELYVGSCPATAEDVETLKHRCGATAVLNVQTDDDLRFLNISLKRLRSSYQACGIELRRIPVRDFDPDDLAAKLPECVDALSELLRAGHRVYLHCTAGSGRSPSIAIAYLAVRERWGLERAAAHVQSCRECSPNLEAIRRAFPSAGSGPPDL